MMDDHGVSNSDINWASGERPVVSAMCAAVGAAAGFVGGLEGLMWWAGAPFTPLRQIPSWVWRVLRVYGPVPPVVGGWVPAALAVVFGAGFGVGGWILATRDNIRHIRGMQIHTSVRKVAKDFRPFQGGLKGAPIHPRVHIGEHQEASHIFFLGGAGGGKTTLLWPLLLSIIARGDRILLLDFKADFTRGLTCPFSLLSPADDRSARWLLGRDVRSRLDAMSFAETMIPIPAGDPIWAKGARGLLIGLVAHLQAEKGTSWGFRDLAELAARVLVDYKLLVSIIVKHHPPAKGFLMGADSRTTQSFLAELSGALTHAIEMGVADDAVLKKQEREDWSVRDWLDPKSQLPRVAVIGWSPDSKEMSQAWAAAIVEQMVRQMTRMTNVSPEKRRVWLFLDEIAQMGRVPSITDALVTLRSKGVRVLFALQSVAQLEKEFDRHVLSIWAGSCATKVICSLGSEQDQMFGHKMLGRRDVERYTHQTTQSGGVVSRSGSWQRAEEDVMKPTELAYQVAPDAKGVRALIISRGKSAAALLRWPFYKAPEVHPERIDAAWQLPGFRRPVWGDDPLPVANVPNDDAERFGPVLNPNAGIPAQAQKQGPDRPRPTGAANKKPQQQVKSQIPAATTARASKAPKEQPEADPFADIVGGALIDAVVPGASIGLGIIDTVGEATPDAPGAAPPTPGIPEPEDEREVGHEPEVGD